MKTSCIVGTVLLAALVGASCGGGSSGGGGPVTTTVVSDATLDGYVQDNTAVVTVGSDPGVGDVDTFAPGVGIGVRMVFCFPLTGIPSNAVIQSAVLRVSQDGLLGTTPFPSHGNLVVDHVALGAGLDAAEYFGSSVQNDIGVLSTDPATGWRTLSVTSRVQDDITTGRPRSDFRLHFVVSDTNNDSLDNLLRLNDGADYYASGRLPSLEITYTTP